MNMSGFKFTLFKTFLRFSVGVYLFVILLISLPTQIHTVTNSRKQS